MGKGAYMMNVMDYVYLFSGGLVCGILLTVIPFVIGAIINFAFKIMRS